ncbi:Dabb family protein [Plantibacter sp. YIM 135347]|uniref:Dabb family protein n=1 Tax=Plantibacter sp. YIM 135347 TaxID=3423919 RepID=UPI003D349939
MTIRHIVSWKLNATDDAGRDASFAVLKQELEALTGFMPDDIISLQVGRNIAYPESNWDVVLVGDYPSLESLERYQVHPEHQRVVAIVKQHVSARSAVDFQLD